MFMVAPGVTAKTANTRLRLPRGNVDLSKPLSDRLPILTESGQSEVLAVG